MRTHYDNLQVKDTASIDVIKGAYKYLSQKWHPDKHPDNRERAERITKIINSAYEVLSDPQKRAEHDHWIKTNREREEAKRQETFEETSDLDNSESPNNHKSSKYSDAGETRNASNDQSKNLLLRIYNGDISLAITYWILNVFVGGLIINLIVLRHIDKNSETIIKEHGEYALLTSIAIILAYYIFINISIWRSAVKYTGPKLFATLAKLTVILFSISLLIEIFTFINKDHSEQLSVSINNENKDLPIMLDSDTRLDSIKIDKNLIFFKHTLVNFSHLAPAAIADLRDSLEITINEGACIDDSVLEMLRNGYKLIYVYNNKHNGYLMQISLTSSDCP